MLELNAATTALVVIDLQEGILPFAGGPHSAGDVVARAARLADKCRVKGAPVVMVRVGWSADFAEALRRAQQAGVQVLAYDCDVTPDRLCLGKQIPCCF